MDRSTLTINGNISNCKTTAYSGGAINIMEGITLKIYGGSISGCSSTNTSGKGKGNAIYSSGYEYLIQLPTSDTDMFSINVPVDAQGTNNALEKYGYPGIYDHYISTPAKFLYRVQFDLNGGLDNSGNTSIDPVLVLSGETLGDILPTNITKDSHNLDKWVYDNNNVVTADTPITNNTILHAVYASTPNISSPTLTKEQSGSEYNAGDWSNEKIVSSPNASINPDRYKISLNGSGL